MNSNVPLAFVIYLFTLCCACALRVSNYLVQSKMTICIHAKVLGSLAVELSKFQIWYMTTTTYFDNNSNTLPRCQCISQSI